MKAARDPLSPFCRSKERTAPYLQRGSFRRESDSSFLCRGGLHQFPNRVENDFELRVVSLFEGIHLASEFLMAGENSSESDERSYDFNANEYGSLRRMLESMATPCSVNAQGKLRLPPHELEVPSWYLKFSNSVFES